jgi:hypothetical protein
VIGPLARFTARVGVLVVVAETAETSSNGNARITTQLATFFIALTSALNTRACAYP